jgi:hypothetical protein
VSSASGEEEGGDEADGDDGDGDDERKTPDDASSAWASKQRTTSGSGSASPLLIGEVSACGTIVARACCGTRRGEEEAPPLLLLLLLREGTVTL